LTTKEGDEEYYQLNDDKWQLFTKVSIDDSITTGIISFDKTGKILYMLDSRDRNTGALKTLNLENNETKLIAEDSRADIRAITSHPTEDNIQAVEVNYDKLEIKVLDNSIKSDIEYLTSLNQGELHINRRTLDDKTWLVAYESDIAPIKYYKYDRANKKAEYLFSNRDELIKYELNTLNPLVIKARDGLDLVSYLTLPNHMTVEDVKKSGQLLPLVLYVHGGPWARDNWGFNPTHQWLANRGYAVLSVNFRGSTGFGKNFINAANKQWGKKMHDDLIDAVNWVVKSKIVDSKKVAIMGGSYGGYATLAGLTFTPDFFACGIDIVGPSNILTLIKSVPPYWEPILNDFKKRVGNWETEADLKALAEASPLTYADRIKKPLFIAQGVHDPRVKQAESDQIVKALNDKNIPVIYALYDDEGHGFARAESRLSFYALAEQFLAKILKGQAEPIGDDLNGANFLLNNTKPTNIEAEKLIDKAIGK
jgi:dipeptidyl aminopeptidase/acylaminoacyl peptidase